jgi:predicted outer membrane repeat protein
MHCYNSDATLTDCAFLGNEAAAGGGGFHCHGSSPTLTGCTFSGNRATGTTARGGGIYSRGSSPTLTGCTFSRNEATFQGGGLYCSDSSPTLMDCIFAFSPGNPAGGAVYCSDEGSTPLLVCCNLYGNANGDWVGCIADQYAVDGNFSEDPLFCDMLSDDLTLCANSPCLPDGNDCAVLIGAHGQGCLDCLSPVEMISWGAIKAMFR